jgi:GWxTD domain-containing protein
MMKRYLILLTALVLSAPVALAQDGKYLEAQLFYAKFFSPADGPYLETYLSVVGNTVNYQSLPEGGFQGKIEVSMIFTKEGAVVNFDKYELLSPVVKDTTNIDFNFLDQQRFILPGGVYDFQITINDPESDMPPYSTTQTIEINFPPDEVSVSGIQLVESYSTTTAENILSKSGYDLVPYVYNFLPDKVNTLTFYTEIYNASRQFGEGESFLINYFVESYESGKKLNKFARFKRESAKEVNILFTNFDITQLASGNYNLVVEVRNRENEVIATNHLFFQRSNPDVAIELTDYVTKSAQNSFVSYITNEDTLRQYIDYLIPVATDVELKFITYQIQKGEADLQMMQNFFLNFWLDRNEVDPEYAWRKYLSAVEVVNDQFGAPGTKGQKGYQTDMGRIFLKYGPPNTISDQPFAASTSGLTINDGGEQGYDSGAVPYQIWHYYTIDNQRNRKFVFANIHLALNDYKLIHSNMPGEINNENWQAELHNRFQQGATLPNNDKYGGKSGDLYNNPR